MKLATIRIPLFAFALTILLLGHLEAYATSQSWDGGAASALWTANNNWSANAAYPVNDDTATFNTTGANWTNISVAGVSAIKYITFDSGSVGSYTIGAPPVNSQTLVMRNDGNFRKALSANKPQYFNAAIQLGPDKGGATYYFQNDHPIAPLILFGNISGFATGGTAGDKAINVNGIGPVMFLGDVSRGNANNLDVYVNNPNTTTLSGTNLLRILRLNGGSGSVLDIGAGAIIFTNSNTGAFGGENFSSTYGGTINGSGAMFLTTGTGENNSDNYVADVNSTLTINCRLRGGVGFELYTGNGVAGTFALNGVNDFTGNVFMNAAGTISANKFGNRFSTDSGLGAGYRVRFSSYNVGGPKLKYTGVGETCNRTFEIASHAKFEQAGTGNLNLSSPFILNAGGGVTVTLMGSTVGTGEISGVISNGNGVAITKEGSGTWTLSAPNVFNSALTVNGGTLNLTRTNTCSAATTVNGGTLALTGASGTLLNTSGITLNTAGTLLIDNTAADNQPNRLRDAAALTLNGGSISFAHTAGAASYSETVGAVTLSAGANTIAASRAAVGQTSALTLTSLTRTSGSVDFVGAGLGADTRNRILINGQADGLIGPWATVNGSALAAYSSTLGVYPAAAAAYTDIAARGPASTIPDSGSSSAIRINSDGVSGDIELAGATTTVGSLTQNTGTDATVNTASKTLRATSIIIPGGKAAITVGAASGDGALAAATAGGGLSLANDSTATLTVNAVIENNTSASSLNKSGSGTVRLASANTFSGGTSISEGTLVLADGNALQNSTLTVGAANPVFDSSVSSHAFTLGAFGGTKDLALADSASTPITLSAGQNNASTTYSGVLSGGGGLTKQGAGTLTLSGANTHSGGTTISGGRVSANHQLALGTGPVVNNATLDFTQSPSTYSGASLALSGAGTNNVSLLSGMPGATTYLNGDYSAFAGLWNIGVAAGASAGRAIMNGRDNAAASIVVRTNATLWSNVAVLHNATLTLQGGNTGESNGQLRLENNAIWSGSIILAGVFTDGNDGFFGNNSGTGYISGQITDGGGNYPVNKVSGGTIAILSTNNTFGGALWVRQGWLRAASIRNLGLASAIGAPTTPANGTIKLGNSTTTAGFAYTGSGDESDRIIDLASTTATLYLDHSGTNLWRMTGNVVNSGAGSKRLQLQGNTGATGELAGVIADYSASYTNNIWKTGVGAWRLSGDNTFKGNVEVEHGQLIVTHNRALGIGPKIVKAANNANNYNPHIHLDGTAGDLTIPADITFQTSNQRAGAIFNEAGNNTILGNIRLTSGDGDTALNSVSGKLTVAGLVFAPADLDRRLRLWGAGDGEISGIISNGVTLALPVYKERGTGTWTLSGANTYSGVTYANNGTLIIGGASGAIAGGIDAGQGGTLVVTNSLAANNNNRLSNSAAVTLNGGKLRFAHPGGAADYSETAGALTVATGESTVETARADEGQTSTLTFSSLDRTGGGSVNFVGESLGDVDNRNRILFTSAPVADNAVIGPWAMYNGTNLASYTAAQGVIAADDSVYSNISAKGPSLIPDDAAAIARINEEGTEGGIALAGETVGSVNGLLQATLFDATVGLSNQIFQTSSLIVGAGMASLTIGTNTTDGLLTPLTAGGTLTLVNHSANALSVNTPVTNNGASAGNLMKLGAGPVRLNGTVGHTGTTMINEGELIFAANALTQTLAGVISGNGILAKEGDGRVNLSAANTYNGLTVVRSGTLMPSNNAALGSTLAGTIVTNGGTIDVGFSGTDNAVNYGNEAFTVSGVGVDGRGAIINSSGRSQYNAIRFLSLAGDTTFGGESPNARWDVRNTDTLNPSFFDMNGHTVTKVGTNMVGLTSTPVLDPGHIDIQQGQFTVEASTTLGGDSNNVMTVRNGAVFDIFSLATPITWKLVMDDGARFYSRSSAGVAVNVWAGPMIFNGYTRIDSASGTSETLAGEISGAGSLVKIGSGNAYLTGTNNTYSGGTYHSNNWLYAYNPGSLPLYATPGKVQVASGAILALYGGDGTVGWTGEQLNALHSGGTFVASNSVMAVDTTYSSVSGLGGMNGFALYKYGTNTLTVTGVNTNRAAPSGEHSNLRVYAGTLNLSSTSSNVYGRCYVLPGTIGATLEINGPTTFTESLYVGNGNSDRSRVIINTNVWANRAWVGINQIANGALIQNDGTFEVAPGTGGTTVFDIGRDGAYGYYRLNGGKLRTGQFALGGGSGNALSGNNGIFEQFGGTVDVTGSGGWLIWGWVGGNGVANMFDGVLVAPWSGNNVNMAHSQDRGSFAMLNLLGPGAFLHTVSNSTSRILNLANTSGNLQSVVNLNAGVILANRVSALNTGTPSLLNFGGGTLRANGSTTLASTFLQGLTAATVYPGGAVIDSSNITVTVNQPLLAPTGYGVASIPVALGGAGYIGPPVVMLSGGSGTGATAIASVDVNASSPTFGQVTGITVTSPGSGYQFTDALTVTLLRGGYTTLAQAGAPVMALNQATGGLTKTGAGTLTLGAANTYGGATTVKSGTLRLGNPLAIQTGTDIVLDGGTLDLNGYTVNNALSGSGVVSNGTVVTVLSPAGEGVLGTDSLAFKSVSVSGTYFADVTADGASDLVAVQGDVNISGLSLQIVDPEALDRHMQYTILTCTGTRTGTFASHNLPDARWHLSYGADGTVKLIFVDGTLIMFR